MSKGHPVYRPIEEKITCPFILQYANLAGPHLLALTVAGGTMRGGRSGRSLGGEEQCPMPNVFYTQKRAFCLCLIPAIHVHIMCSINSTHAILIDCAFVFWT